MDSTVNQPIIVGEDGVEGCRSIKENNGLVTAQDPGTVTDIKITPEIFPMSEENLRNILDSLPVQIAYIDRNLKYCFNNKLHAKRSGFSNEEIFGQPYIPQEIMQPYVKKVLSGQKVKFDSKDDGFECGEVNFIPDLDIKGKAKGFFMLVSEVTDRQQASLTLKNANDLLEQRVAERTQDLQREIVNRKDAEASLRLSHNFMKFVIDAVPDPISVKDQQHRIVITNAAFSQGARMSSEEIIGKSNDDLCGKDADIVTRHDKKAFKQGFLQYQMTWGNRDFLIKKVCFESEDHKKYLVCVYQNITKILASEKKLAKTIQKLKTTNEDLDNFAYICSHDLHEPCRTMLNFSKLLSEHLEGTIDGDAKRYLHFIIDGSKRMQDMIKGALVYAKITNQVPGKESINCEILLKRVLENLHVAIEEAQATITHDPLPKLIGNSATMTMLFQNLIANSLKFKNQHKLLIHIGVMPHKSGYTFFVRDNGIGIDMKHKGRLFNLFYQQNKEEDYPGTGIGLAVCKKIINMYGGKIWVESQLGKGATFYFTIPQKNQSMKDYGNQS